MAEQVLVIPTEKLYELGSFEGLCTEMAPFVSHLLQPQNQRYLPRPEMEVEPAYRQIIPYVVFRCRGDRNSPDLFFSYARFNGGESRLSGKYSLGVGGHICADDAVNGLPYVEGMLRELDEEIDIAEAVRDSDICNSIIGVINDTRDPVGLVHLGVVHLVDLCYAEIRTKEDCLQRAGFRSLSQLQDLRELDMLEGWSELVLDHLLESSRSLPIYRIHNNEMLRLHNTSRVAAGVPILTYSPELMQSATNHAQWMATRRRLTHNTGWFGIGGGVASRLLRVGITETPVGENIFRGSIDPAVVYAEWFASLGHRQNILSPRLRRMGLGFFGSYWCAQFTG
jgi:predicted NUDIX family phosphoesterase